MVMFIEAACSFTLFEIEVRDFEDLFPLQVLEDDNLVHTVEELGPEELLHLLQHLVLHVLVRLRVAWIELDVAEPKPLVHLDRPDAHVRGHDDDGVSEVDRSPLAVGELSVLHHLQEDVEHFGVRLLDLIEQHHAVRISPHLFGELSTLIVTDVSGRGSNEAADRESLHVFGHVDPDHVRVLLVEVSRQSLGKLRLTHTRGTEEDKAAHGALRILQPGPGSANRTANRNDRVMLPDDPLMQIRLHSQELLALGFDELGDRDSGPALDDLSDLGLADDRLDLLPIVPLFFARRDAGFQLVAFGLKLEEGVVGFVSLGEVLHLGLHLREPRPIRSHVRGRQTLLQPDAGRCLVDQVDRLVGQGPVGDVALR